MKFKLEMTCDNDAFAEDGPEEIARILVATAARVRDADESGVLFDLNGNRVGIWEFVEDNG